MNDRELEGVVAHELGTSRIATFSPALLLRQSPPITLVARMALWFGGGRDDEEDRSPWAAIMMLILAPIAAMLIQMAISRTREYAADQTSAEVTHNPNELIAALSKLETWSKRITMSDVNPATAHLFITIQRPEFSCACSPPTHPPKIELPACRPYSDARLKACLLFV